MSKHLEQRIRELELAVETLKATIENDVVISNYNIAGVSPTDAELDSAFGDAAGGALYNGFIGLLDDNGGGSVVILCIVVNDSWWYESLTLAT